MTQGLLEALDGVGLKLRPEVPFDAQLLIKYFFRDAKPQTEAKQVRGIPRPHSCV